MTRGSYELVAAAGFAGDGKMYLGTNSRAQGGTTAIAWPAGAIVEAAGCRRRKLQDHQLPCQRTGAVFAAGFSGDEPDQELR